MPDIIVQATYFLGALLFILGLKQMSSPVTARRGIVWAGVGMVLAVLVTYFHHEINQNYILMTVAIAIGGMIAYISGKKVAITAMPQMIALYNGMGGGAAAAIAAVVLIQQQPMSITVHTLTILGAFIGAVVFSGSLVVFAKLQGIIKGVIHFPMQQWINALVLVIALTFGLAMILNGIEYELNLLVTFFVLTLVFGVLMTLPIRDADMPVVISLYNALTGLAVGFEGYVLENPAMMIAGIVASSAGALLAWLIAKAKNRSIVSAIFSSTDTEDVRDSSAASANNAKEIDSVDASVMLAFAKKVIVIPSYGMAIAQAQHKVWEMVKQLQDKGVSVKFAIHPVAGRMPGHMNVLLAEAGVPYDIIYNIDEINDEFATTDVVLVIGANDVINPAARTDVNSPIYGMPILNADHAKNVIVIKRGQGTGFSGVKNRLFFADNTRMLYGDGQAVVGELVSNIKAL